MIKLYPLDYVTLLYGGEPREDVISAVGESHTGEMEYVLRQYGTSGAKITLRAPGPVRLLRTGQPSLDELTAHFKTKDSQLSFWRIYATDYLRFVSDAGLARELFLNRTFDIINGSPKGPWILYGLRDKYGRFRAHVRELVWSCRTEFIGPDP